MGVRGCRVESIRKGNSQNTRYSEFAIALVKAYKAGNEDTLQHLLEVEKPAADYSSSSLTVINHVAGLDEKIANLQRTTSINSQANADRVREKLKEIALCNQRSQQRQQVLSDAELLAAENSGIERALAIFSAEEDAKENALAHLRASKISGNQ